MKKEAETNLFEEYLKKILNIICKKKILSKITFKGKDFTICFRKHLFF